MLIDLVVTVEISDDIPDAEMKQELRMIREDISMCLGGNHGDFPINSVAVRPVQNTPELRKAKHFMLYL